MALRKIINSTYITLDGIIQDPQDWPSTGGFSEAGNRIQTELLERCDAVLLGRRTYDAFAPVWAEPSSDPLNGRMHELPKYVVTSSLAEPPWNNTVVLDAEPIDAIRSLKQEPGADIVQYGFGRLAGELVAEGLLDELRLWVHPFMLGTGSADDLLHHPGRSGSFTLAGSEALPNGIIILTYESRPRSEA